MPKFNNVKSLMKHMKDNIHETMEGKIITCKCPGCGKEAQIRILKDSKGRCSICNKEFDIKFNVK